jgi:hypothetical protein
MQSVFDIRAELEGRFDPVRGCVEWNRSMALLRVTPKM